MAAGRDTPNVRIICRYILSKASPKRILSGAHVRNSLRANHWHACVGCLPSAPPDPLSTLSTPLSSQEADLWRPYQWGCFALWSLVKFSQWGALAEDLREGGEWGWGSYSPGSFSAASGWLCPSVESYRSSQGDLRTVQILAMAPSSPIRPREQQQLHCSLLLHTPLWTGSLSTSHQITILLRHLCPAGTLTDTISQ